MNKQAETEQREQHEQNRNHTDDEDDVEDLEPDPVKHNLYNKINVTVERFATTRIGQFVIERVDKVLQIIEDTAKWSLPQDDESPKLQRPLSWMPFLTMIMALRFVRAWLTVAAIMIGNEPVMPRDMVYFIQTRRRKLRSINMHGRRVRHERESEIESKSKRPETSILAKFSQLFATAICRPGYLRKLDKPSSSHNDPHNKRQTEMRKKGKRFREEDNDLTCDQLLRQYANDDSADDSDFVPNMEDGLNDYNEDKAKNNGTNTSGDEAAQTTDDAVECDNNEMPETSKGKSTQNEHDNTAGSTHDKSAVDLDKSKGSSKVQMPLPIQDIKKEPLTDAESSSEQQQGSEQKTTKENGPSSGGGSDNRETADVATIKSESSTTTPYASNNLNVVFNNANDRKSTPGHESAAAMIPNVFGPVAASTAMAEKEYKLKDTSKTKIHISPSSATTTTTTTTSSNSALSTLMLNDDFNVDAKICLPHISSTSAFAAPCNLQRSISASSTEDVFYSPIGFNGFNNKH